VGCQLVVGLWRGRPADNTLNRDVATPDGLRDSSLLAGFSWMVADVAATSKPANSQFTRVLLTLAPMIHLSLRSELH
jgi:hypothetical protein